MDIKIFDGCFKHLTSPSCLQGYDPPKSITWYRGQEHRDITVYTDHFLPSAHLDNNDSKIKIAWLIEPFTINTRGYSAVEVNHGYYDYIISHDQRFLSRFPQEKRVFCPASGSSLYGHEWQIYPKDKMVLTVVGDKKRSVGHRLRYEVAAKLGHRMDVVGRGFNYFPPDMRAETYAPYRYQVAIHNTPVGDYWSDILLDCFATGTVPIIWGSHYLKKYFDMKGIICWDTIEQLERILEEISEGDYNAREVAIRTNHEVAKRDYKVVEDFLYKTFFKNFE